MVPILTLIIDCLIMMFLNKPGVSEASDVVVVSLITLFSVAYLFYLMTNKRMRDIAFPLFWGYILRIVLIYIYINNIYTLPHSNSDDIGFYNDAVQYAHGYEISYGGAFSKTMGTLFSWFGTSKLFGQFLLMLCSVVTIHVAASTLDEVVEDKNTKKISMYILCLLPNFAILSCIFRRESVITMLVTISLFYFVRWFVRKKEMYFFVSLAFVMLGTLFHSGVIGLAIGYIVARLLYDNKRSKLKISAKGIILAILFMFVFIFLYNNYSDTLFSKFQGVENIEDVAVKDIGGGSSYAAYVGNSDSISNMVIYTIPRILYFLFSPFPWQWRGLADIISFCLSSLFYLCTVIQTIKYLLSRKKDNKELVVILLILTICTLIVFAWGVSTTGTALRHRDKMIVLYILLFGITLKRTKNYNKERNSLTFNRRMNMIASHIGHSTDKYSC